MIKLLVRLKKLLFPNAPLSYEEIRATYDAKDDDTSTLESVHDVEPGPDGSFIDEARQTAKSAEERFFERLSVKESKKLDRLSAQLKVFASTLNEAVMKDAQGQNALGFPSGRVRLLLQQEDGSPKTFIHSYKNDLVNTYGYKVLEEKCKELGLAIEFETDYDDVWEEQDSLTREMGISSLAPTLFHVQVVVTGWK